MVVPAAIIVVVAAVIAVLAVAPDARAGGQARGQGRHSHRVGDQAGVSTVPTTVSIIGTIAARYDMPIGVEGDAGRVAAIYVEAGDHVKRGQVLARLNVSVLEPQVANLEAALEQARAEAELADAEYRPRAGGRRLGRAVGRGNAAAQVRRRDRRGQGQSRRRAAGGGRRHAWRAPTVRAPADGIILTRNVEVGQTATPGGEALFRLSRRRRSRTARPGRRAGSAAAQGRSDRQCAADRHHPQSTKAESGCCGAVIDPQTRLGMARVALTPDPNLRPGAFARAEVTVSNADRAVLPQTAVLTDDKGSYVLIVNAQNKIERRAVHVSGIVQNGVTIADGHRRQGSGGRHRGRVPAGGRSGQPGLESAGPIMRNISAWAIRHPGHAHRPVRRAVLPGRGRVHPPADQPEPRCLVSRWSDVNISQPGAAPTEMETQIAQKVEGSISSIGNVRNITTYIVEGQVGIFVQFEIGTPIDRAVTDVRDAVAKVRNDLPQGILEPQVTRENVDGGAFAYYAVTTTSLTPEQLSWFIDNTVTKRLLAIAGVAQVSRSGGVDREIRVELDPAPAAGPRAHGRRGQ